MKKMISTLKRIQAEKLDFDLSFTQLGEIRASITAGSEHWIVEWDERGRMNIEVFGAPPRAKPPRNLKRLFSRVQRAWYEAACDLQIQMIGDYEFRDRKGERFIATVFLPEFGSEQGTLIFTGSVDHETYHAACDMGFYVSILSRKAYDHYDRAEFISVLQDYGWRKKTRPPAWYDD